MSRTVRCAASPSSSRWRSITPARSRAWRPFEPTRKLRLNQGGYMHTMMSLRRLAALACLVMAVMARPAAAATDAARHVTDLVYATVNGKSLSLDLHLPAGVSHPPLLVFVHGGAWTTGSKAQYPTFLLERGFAVASLDFRSSNEAPFPADVFDIKAG